MIMDEKVEIIIEPGRVRVLLPGDAKLGPDLLGALLTMVPAPALEPATVVSAARPAKKVTRNRQTPLGARMTIAERWAVVMPRRRQVAETILTLLYHQSGVVTAVQVQQALADAGWRATSASSVSNYLQELVEAGLLTAKRDGHRGPTRWMSTGGMDDLAPDPPLPARSNGKGGRDDNRDA